MINPIYNFLVKFTKKFVNYCSMHPNECFIQMKCLMSKMQAIRWIGRVQLLWNCRHFSIWSDAQYKNLSQIYTKFKNVKLFLLYLTKKMIKSWNILKGCYVIICFEVWWLLVIYFIKVPSSTEQSKISIQISFVVSVLC